MKNLPIPRGVRGAAWIQSASLREESDPHSVLWRTLFGNTFLKCTLQRNIHWTFVIRTVATVRPAHPLPRFRGFSWRPFRTSPPAPIMSPIHRQESC
ncbi:hypothetical protein L596_002530 [Steinernema carpocapsae]|uniref:Uncharacterized protein n=1 Tax=Steinernema carpocapsae TaxID=34508 RepID=A0A4V6I7Q4_STECR|nr:hypothetical protein L596_002530 [Steinernema carpocapsae]